MLRLIWFRCFLGAIFSYVALRWRGRRPSAMRLVVDVPPLSDEGVTYIEKLESSQVLDVPVAKSHVPSAAVPPRHRLNTRIICRQTADCGIVTGVGTKVGVEEGIQPRPSNNWHRGVHPKKRITNGDHIARNQHLAFADRVENLISPGTILGVTPKSHATIGATSVVAIASVTSHHVMPQECSLHPIVSRADPNTLPWPQVPRGTAERELIIGLRKCSHERPKIEW